MTEEIRDAARPPGGSAETPGEPLAVPPVEPVRETGAAAESFGAETVNAERLQAPEEPDYKDRWLRAEAELQNTRRRAARDREETVRAAEDRVLVEMIELLDDLERALAALAPGQDSEPWAQGVALTAQRMRDALARRGVTVLATVGQPFDPAFHEALLEVPAPKGVAPGSVAQEILRGYRRGDRALRAARVTVARADR
jgi:molecular chaperone GrpE